METVSKGAGQLGKSLGGAGESGASGVLDRVLSPGGLLVIGVLVLVALWMGRR